ncbi:MAG: peptidoglycan-binding protein [Verrucomicrobia bacterium]|nr:peptidoglycan-binding protein [Verrucomicrobiota bacterium]MBV9673905.1 peptidoglycan-binding protein [Verrucomicrobiota bacterium]
MIINRGYLLAGILLISTSTCTFGQSAANSGAGFRIGVSEPARTIVIPRLNLSASQLGLPSKLPIYLAPTPYNGRFYRNGVQPYTPYPTLPSASSRYQSDLSRVNRAEVDVAPVANDPRFNRPIAPNSSGGHQTPEPRYLVQFENSEVRAIQHALRLRGYYPGDTDGYLGPSTQSAIESFQLANRHAVTGQPDQWLLTALGI